MYITKDEVHNAILQNVISFVPCEDGLENEMVCQIGEYWFYYCNLDEQLKSIDEITIRIADILNNPKCYNIGDAESQYYIYYIKENL